ncbi:interferon-induced very large GTPase 1-like isoform X2 [Dysidea avara]|uniref:interferon-induced very large GTPase 1-like isoform X2 n=1 Tax=Dysidea avara TaxID=196820 RepID=UPI0033165EEF
MAGKHDSELRQVLQLQNVKKTKRKLGNGSNAEVFEVEVGAATRQGAFRAAAKIMFESIQVGAFIDDFHKEIVTLSHVDHKNVVKFIGIHYPPRAIVPWIIMELMHTSLFSMIEEYRGEKKDITLEMKLHILLDTCNGLQFLHSKNIIHRDLTSKNVLLTESFVAKVADLGLAKVLKKNPQSFTRGVCTEDFRPPESYLETPKYGTPFDVFSLACICIHLISMRYPDPARGLIQDEITEEIIDLHLTDFQKRKKYFTEEFTQIPGLKDVVEQCLEKTPHNRPAVGKIISFLEVKLSQQKQKFRDFLSNMNLLEKFPQQLSLKDGLIACQETLKITRTNQLPVLPYLILQKIMMCDCRCLTCVYTKQFDSDSDSDSDLNSDSDDKDNEDDGRIYPVDCLLAVIHCCDDILRQDVMYKLSLCQLAVPLLLPNPLDDSVTLLLWALRSLYTELEYLKVGINPCQIVDYKAPIVTFVKLGKLHVSKSQLLNNVVGIENCFFHWELERYKCKRLVDGLVELCCYYPSGKDAAFYSDIIIFLNLRGDAQLYPKQVEFLQKISVLSFVLVAERNIHEDNTKILQRFAAAPGGVVILLEGKKNKLLNQVIPEDKYSYIHLRHKNRTIIINEIITKMVKKLESLNAAYFKPLSDCCQFAYDVGIKVDEDNEYSKAGKKLADLVMEQIHSVPSNKVKQALLPLQGLWHQLAMYDKERYRQTARKDTTIAEYNIQLIKKRMDIRKSQIELSTTLTPLMDCFMKGLLVIDVNTRKYFLRWLKLHLDDHSKKILHAKYRYTGEQELIRLEHLFREMGQIYESRMDPNTGDIPDRLRDEAKHLPQVMAEIMGEGHALELMDGDVSHVPVTWVLAVIEELKVVCGKDAREKHGGKVFILSVLGIQSTGKSTLLNTMFGLRFNVGAGRCTSDAYMQLLPLNNSLRNEIGCDYVLIIDTGGLRSPQLQILQHYGLKQHDNEFATFVIGLADVTIININGETLGDLGDILQTALHAFIRMKCDMYPSCLFALQNVSHLVSSKMLIPQNKLDQMAQIAAKIENCSQLCKSFCDVIRFDDRTDVFYFPLLWKYDPPMALVNSGYTECAHELRNAIFRLVKSKKITTYYLGTLKFRIEKLWHAVLEENVVFNFNNAFEVYAYIELNRQFSQWSGNMHHELLQWRYDTMRKISSFAKDCYIEAEHMFTKIHTQLDEKMTQFFDTSEYAYTLSNWRQETDRRLKNVETNCKKEAKFYCDKLSECYPSDNEIQASIIEILRELFLVSDPLVIRKLSDTPLSRMSCSLKLDINRMHLISTRGIWSKPLDRNDVLQATRLTEGYLTQVSEYLLSVKSMSFSSSYIHRMLKDLLSAVDKSQKEESQFAFTPEYKVDLALVACAYAYDVFKQATKKF